MALICTILIYWSVIANLIYTLLVLVSVACCILCFYLGRRSSYPKALQQSRNELKSEVERLSILLEHAGIRINEQGNRLIDNEEISESWTGEIIATEVRPAVGTVRRWDEPSHHP